MDAECVFERAERKFLLDPAQERALRRALSGRMHPDLYSPYPVMSLYYDTPDYLLVRRSLERPVYKEKLRLRSYGVPTPDSTVFLELKKKLGKTVFKRRAPMTLSGALRLMAGHPPAERDQILREITAFTDFYPLAPRALIAYERTALVDNSDPLLRLTLDNNMRYRAEDLDLAHGAQGAPLPFGGGCIVEVKLTGAMPLWLAHLFSSLAACPQPISKYGTCYQQCLLPALLDARRPAPAVLRPACTQHDLTGGLTCA